MENKETLSFAILNMIFAVISISLSNFFAKICIHDVTPSFTTFMRFFAPFILLSLYLLVKSGFKDLSFKNAKLHFIRALSLTFSQLFLFHAMKNLSMTEAVLLYNTGPIFIVIISYFFLKNKKSIYEIIGVLLGVLGVLFIVGVSKFHLNISFVFGILSGLLFAISQVSLHTVSPIKWRE